MEKIEKEKNEKKIEKKKSYLQPRRSISDPGSRNKLPNVLPPDESNLPHGVGS